jgi:hypothetical protein
LNPTPFPRKTKTKLLRLGTEAMLVLGYLK